MEDDNANLTAPPAPAPVAPAPEAKSDDAAMDDGIAKPAADDQAAA